jgi:hypothetical protein
MTDHGKTQATPSSKVQVVPDDGKIQGPPEKEWVVECGRNGTVNVRIGMSVSDPTTSQPEAKKKEPNTNRFSFLSHGH